MNLTKVKKELVDVQVTRTHSNPSHKIMTLLPSDLHLLSNKARMCRRSHLARR